MHKQDSEWKTKMIEEKTYNILLISFYDICL